jgi:hypothetical protein
MNLDAGCRAEPYPETVPVRENNNKIRELNLREVNRGYIVNVGCHTFAISTKEELLPLLTQYINEPSLIEERWFSDNLF